LILLWLPYRQQELEAEREAEERRKKAAEDHRARELAQKKAQEERQKQLDFERAQQKFLQEQVSTCSLICFTQPENTLLSYSIFFVFARSAPEGGTRICTQG
jgi:hypothetical protein